ncbi:MAG: MSMEG_0570 family nitrogen starvation response protein [Burkholderiaceae bacterium]|jgi:uncharacterized repeat protein (TIGR04042 family)
MPVTLFRVRWPDQSETVCYSPSTVVRDFLAAGESYALADFRGRTREALQRGSARVQAKYGYACSRAMDELVEIERRVARFEDRPDAHVTVLEID